MINYFSLPTPHIGIFLFMYLSDIGRWAAGQRLKGEAGGSRRAVRQAWSSRGCSNGEWAAAVDEVLVSGATSSSATHSSTQPPFLQVAPSC